MPIKTKKECKDILKDDENIATEQANFLLPHNKWDEFLLALKNKANSNAKLTKLLKTKGVFG